MELSKLIKTVPDFPKQGILFYDVPSIFEHPEGFKLTLDGLNNFCKDKEVDKVVGIESRGFLMGGALADRLGAGFALIRKPGKIPGEVVSQSYDLEYGTDTIEINKASVKPGDKVIIHDDLLATGGTVEAAAKLIESLGGEVLQVVFIVELTFLNGRERLSKYDVHSLVQFDSEEA